MKNPRTLPADERVSGQAPVWRFVSVRRVNCALSILCIFLLCLYIAVGAELLRRVRFSMTGAVVVDGHTFYLQPTDTYLTQYVLDWGSYEPAETELFRSKVEPGDTVIDVGANIGWYTIIASKLVGDKGRVIAFEPEPTSFAYLKRNVEANGCKNIIIEQKALSNEEGTLELFIATEHLGVHRIYDWGEGRKSVTVDAVRLDDYMENIGGAVDVIKIDTEGAEGVILEGTEETLRQNHGVKLFVEYAPEALRRSDYDPEKLFQWCQALGFEFQGISERRNRVFPVNDYQALLRAQDADPSMLNFYLNRPTVERNTGQ